MNEENVNRTYIIKKGHSDKLDFIKENKIAGKNRIVNNALNDFWENHPELLEGIE